MNVLQNTERKKFMKMKKFLIIISAAVMSMCFTACAGNDNTNVGSQSTESVQTSLSSVTAENESSAEAVQTSLSSETDESESITEISQASSSEITDVESSTESSEISAPSETAAKTESETSAETANSAETSNFAEIFAPETSSDECGKILVAYFSATNNTEGIAQKLAGGLGAELYEIIPEQPYTDADLDYGDPNSRSTVEMNDPSARPAISGPVENMEQYDVVLIGYPIWWGEAPRIMSTFIESYDFSGKTLAAFCTSASSGFGSSDSALRSAASDADWLDGRRFPADASADDVMKWANDLGVN